MQLLFVFYTFEGSYIIVEFHTFEGPTALQTQHCEVVHLDAED